VATVQAALAARALERARSATGARLS
jgi:hypothetical protein